METQIKQKIKEAREEYLSRTQSLYLELFHIRQKQNMKYLFNHLNNTLEPIVFESNEEKLVLSKIDEVFNEVSRKFNL